MSIKITEKSKCSGCGACASVCPKRCINMAVDEEGFKYPAVDAELCVNCGLCETACPIITPAVKEAGQKPAAYAAMNNDDEIRMESSSGGIFTLLAELVINQGGVVFGAAFADDFKSVHHIAVDNINDLDRLRGSKYLQSSIDDSYVKAKQYLENGRAVLFTGTPCQIGGLRAFLKRDYPNLYTQDIICHGAPSPLVWKKYVELREEKAASQTRRTFFRHKKFGWKTYSVLFDFTNSTEYVQTLKEDLYMRGFLANLYLRPSCYDCSFKGMDRLSDITLADFWGIQKVLPEMDDDKGTSLVLVNSEKGSKLWQSIQQDIRCEAVDIDEVIQYNTAAIYSCALPKKRKKVIKALKKTPFDKVIQKYTAVTFFDKVKYKIRAALSKIKHSITK